MNMIERVGRVLSEEGYNIDADMFHYSYAMRQKSYDALAKTIIEAMRNPAFDVESVSYHEGMSRRDWWEAMLDAALQEQTP
jgi:hypothetical protein